MRLVEVAAALVRDEVAFRGLGHVLARPAGVVLAVIVDAVVVVHPAQEVLLVGSEIEILRALPAEGLGAGVLAGPDVALAGNAARLDAGAEVLDLSDEGRVQGVVNVDGTAARRPTGAVPVRAVDALTLVEERKAVLLVVHEHAHRDRVHADEHHRRVPLDKILMETVAGVEPQVVAHLSVAHPVHEDVRLHRDRAVGLVAQQLDVDLVVVGLAPVRRHLQNYQQARYRASLPSPRYHPGLM